MAAHLKENTDVVPTVLLLYSCCCCCNGITWSKQVGPSPSPKGNF